MKFALSNFELVELVTNGINYKKILQLFDDITEKHMKDDSEINPYVYIKVFLPLKRIMDMEHQEVWKTDGNLWPSKELQ